MAQFQRNEKHDKANEIQKKIAATQIKRSEKKWCVLKKAHTMESNGWK